MNQVTIKFKYVLLAGISITGKRILPSTCTNNFFKVFFSVLFIIILKRHTDVDKIRSDSTKPGPWRFPEDIDHASYLLNEAYKKIEALEEKIISLEGRVPKTYPDVNFLNYLKRKRVLVSYLV